MSSYQQLSEVIKELTIELFMVRSILPCESCEVFKSHQAYSELPYFFQFIGLPKEQYIYKKMEFDWNSPNIDRYTDEEVNLERETFFKVYSREFIGQLVEKSIKEMNESEFEIYTEYLSLKRSWDEDELSENYFVYYADFDYTPAVKIKILFWNGQEELIKKQGLEVMGNVENFFDYLARTIAGFVILPSEKEEFSHEKVQKKEYKDNDPLIESKFK